MIKSIFRRGRGLSCDHVMEVLQSYLDGEIDADEARKVAAHLEDCQECDLESTVYRNIKKSLNHRPEAIDPSVLNSLRTFADRVARGDIVGPDDSSEQD